MTLKDFANKVRSGEKLTATEQEEARKLIRAKMAESVAKFKADIARKTNGNEGNK